MRIFEIILKLAFLVGSIYSISTQTVATIFLVFYLLVCIVLGIVIFFNEKQSYGYELNNREIIIRRIEGSLLVVFAVFIFIIQLK